MDLNEKDLEELERYLTDEMPSDEKVVFEKKIKESDQLKEFVEIYNRIDHLEDDHWAFNVASSEKIKEATEKFRKKEVTDFSEKIRAQRAQFSAESSNDKKFQINYKFLAGIAACLLVLLYVAYPKSTNLNSLYQQHNSWSELPSMAVKNDTPQQLALDIERTFQEKKYDSTIILTNQIIKNDTLNRSTLFLYLGVSQLELNDFEAALETFQKLSESNSINNHKGMWYTTLVYLKQGDKDAAINTLQQLVKDERNYRYEEAKKMLRKIR